LIVDTWQSLSAKDRSDFVFIIPALIVIVRQIAAAAERHA
jgi:hypothetical protein